MSKAKTSDEEGHGIDYYYNYVPGRIRIETPFLHNNPQHVATFESTIKSSEITQK